MPSDLRLVINSYYQDLSTTEKKIADYLMQHPQTSASMSIQALSHEIQTSTATISRFAKRLGYQSFQELKIALGIEERLNSGGLLKDISLEDSPKTIAQKVFSANIRSLEDTQKFLDEDALSLALTLMRQANRTAFYGLGGSLVVAMDAYHKFMRTSLPCEFQIDYHLQLMSAAKLTENDCAIVVSHTGRNQDTMRLCEILAENDVPIICITSYAGSPIAQMAKSALIAVAEETEYRSEAISAMQAQFSLVDSLFMLYTVSEYQENEVARHKIRQIIQATRLD